MEAHLDFMRYVHHKNTFYKPPHTHDLCELAYYVSGYGSLSRGEESCKYKKGTIHLVQGGIPHDENNEAESKIILLYFKMSDGSLPSGVYADRSGAVLSLLRQLRFETQENLPHKQEMTDCILNQILLTLKRQLFPRPSESKGFNHIVRYIDENFQFDIDIHKIAAKAFYSYDRFRHVFKEHTGLAPHEYITSKRIDLAKFLIDMDPDISLAALADECGFSSLPQFSNAFKAKTSHTPSAYKKQAKGMQ